MTIRTRTEQSLSDLVQRARKEYQWLKKIRDNCGPQLNKLSDYFGLTANISVDSLAHSTSEKANVVELEYIGLHAPSAHQFALAHLEKVLDAKMNEYGEIKARCKRITVVFRILNMPAHMVASKNEPATEKQKTFADKLGLKYHKDITKGQMSNLIDAALVKN